MKYPKLVLAAVVLLPGVLQAGDIQTNVGATLVISDNNTSLGDQAGDSLSNGTDNALYGAQAGKSLTSGDNNTFIGSQSGSENNYQSNNTFVGALSGSMSTASDNTFIGSESGLSNTTGSDNTFVGEEAGKKNTTGSDNVFIGEDAGFKNESGKDNLAVGNSALRSNISGEFNTAVGSDAGYDLGATETSAGIASRNTFAGNSAGRDLGSGVANTFVGDNAGPHTESAHFNTFMGFQAGFDNNRTNKNNSHRNTAIGAYAGFSNREGEDNVWIGALTDSGQWQFDQDTEVSRLRSGAYQWVPGYDDDNSRRNNSDNTIYRTTVVGSFASTNGDDSIAIGHNARAQQSNSIALGSNSQALGQWDIAVGDQSQSSHKEAITIGFQAQSRRDFSVSLGNNNTVSWEPQTDGMTSLGFKSECVEIDTENTAESCYAHYRFSNVVSQNFSAIAAEGAAASLELWADNGRDAADKWSLQSADSGDFSISVTAAEAPAFSLSQQGDLTISGGLSLNSDRRLKTRIEPVVNALADLNRLEGKTFHWQAGTGRSVRRQYGLIAQEVEAIFPELVATDQQGIKSVNYLGLTAVMINAIKQQQQMLMMQKMQIDRLQQYQLRMLKQAERDSGYSELP